MHHAVVITGKEEKTMMNKTYKKGKFTGKFYGEHSFALYENGVEVLHTGFFHGEPTEEAFNDMISLLGSVNEAHSHETEFSIMLRELRLKRRITTLEMAKILNMPPSVYCDIEHGRSRPCNDKLKEIIDVLDLKEQERKSLLRTMEKSNEQ